MSRITTSTGLIRALKRLLNKNSLYGDVPCEELDTLLDRVAIPKTVTTKELEEKTKYQEAEIEYLRKLLRELGHEPRRFDILFLNPVEVSNRIATMTVDTDDEGDRRVSIIPLPNRLPTESEVEDVLMSAFELLRAENERLQREVKHLTSSEKKAAAVSMQAQAEVWSLRRLIRELTDPDPCDFDHKGGCQAHGYLTLKPGETCPQYDAQQIVKKYEAAL